MLSHKHRSSFWLSLSSLIAVASSAAPFSSFTCSGVQVSPGAVQSWTHADHAMTDTSIGFCTSDGRPSPDDGNAADRLYKQKTAPFIVLPCTDDLTTATYKCCPNLAVYTKNGRQVKCG